MTRLSPAPRYLATIAAILALPACGAKSNEAFPESEYRFGEVLQGRSVVHDFPVRNPTERDLVIRRIGTSDGVVLLHVDSVIPPAGKGVVRVSVATERRRGAVDELANVYTESMSKPVASLHVKGTVVLPIEVMPRNQAYFFTVKGETATQALSLVNYGEQPVRLTGIKSENPYFKVRSEPVRPGRRYKLTVTLDPTTPAGKHEGQVTVATDSPQFPEVVIPSFAIVKDSLSTSLDTVQFGQIAIGQLDNPVISRKTIMVTKHKGNGFKVLSATTNLPFLKTEVMPQASGESFLVEVQILSKRAKRGRVAGILRITTNDPSRPELQLPIQANIV
jgi:Protein of unknown function (DUF1573)